MLMVVLGLEHRSGAGVHEPGVPVSPPDEIGRLAVRTPDLEHLPVPRRLVGVARREDDVVSLVCLHRRSPLRRIWVV